MNERIKELVIKAYNNTGQPEAEFLSVFMRCYSEKLAELIVNDCVSICDEQSEDYLKNRKIATDFDEKCIFAEGEAACDIVKYKIKKYFGSKL